MSVPATSAIGMKAWEGTPFDVGFQEQAYTLAFAYAELPSGLLAITSYHQRLITTLYGGIRKGC